MVDPEPSRKDPRTVRGAIIVGASVTAFSIGVFAYYLVAGRLLGPEQYGLAAALQGAIVVVATPTIAFQWSTARVIASHPGVDRAAAFAVYRRALIWATVAMGLLALVASLVTWAIQTAGNPVPVWPLVATYAAIACAVPFYIGEGALQGEHRYTGFAWSLASTGVLRGPLLLLLILLPVGDVTASVLAVTIAFAVGAVWSMALTRDELRVRTAPPPTLWRDFLGGLPAAAIGLTGIAMLTNVDVIAAKLSFGGTEAGLFGAAAVLVKGLLVVPQALTIVLLPRVAERRARGAQTGSLLAIGVTIMACTGAIAILLAIPLEGPIMEITFGSAFAPAATYLVPFFGATTLLGALLILVNHHVARSDHRFAWAVGVLALVQIAALAIFGKSAYDIISIDAIVAAIGLVIHEMMYFRTDESMVHGIRAQYMQVLGRMRHSQEV